MKNRILIADDHEAIRHGLRSLLERAACEICGEASNGQEAVQKARELHPDLVILDLSMPQLNGIEAMPQILASAPETKVLVFSVHESLEFRRASLRMGAHGYAVKSAPVVDLIAEVKRLLSD